MLILCVRIPILDNIIGTIDRCACRVYSLTWFLLLLLSPLGCHWIYCVLRPCPATCQHSFLLQQQVSCNSDMVYTFCYLQNQGGHHLNTTPSRLYRRMSFPPEVIWVPMTITQFSSLKVFFFASVGNWESVNMGMLVSTERDPPFSNNATANNRVLID